MARRKWARLLVTLALVTVCFWGVWNSGREGFAQLYASYGMAADRLDAAERAVRLSPSAPEAHYVRARLLTDKGALAEAAGEMERAVALRPHDYAFWLELGRVRDQVNDSAGALSAFKESVRLAPFYAQPRWQLGNALLREGRPDEAFVELRRASISNPRLLPQVLNLAWASTGGDAERIERAVQPETAEMHLALARLFIRRGKINEAVRHFRAGGDDVSAEERRALLKELLAGKHFVAAYEVWSVGHRMKAEKNPSAGEGLLNGGFEETVSLNEPGFGWQLPQEMKAVQAAQDVAEPRAGRQSLRLSWNGNSDTAAPFISQLVLVEPNSRYSLRFAARTEEIVTATRPLITVTDVGGDDRQQLGQAVVLPQGTSGWQDYSVEFSTNETTSAVLISVRRQDCPSSPCPIFGRAWLDDFSIQKVTPEAGNRD